MSLQSTPPQKGSCPLTRPPAAIFAALDALLAGLDEPGPADTRQVPDSAMMRVFRALQAEATP